ncbi:MAG: Gfo/Idh/MocA family protein, partial [Pirellulales bacterium]
MSERSRTLVVGAGSIGERHVRCLLATDRAEVAVCEPNSQVRISITDRYGLKEAYSSLEEALASDYSMAVVATPAPVHIPQARQLIRHGTNCLVEKPLSLSRDGVVELEREAAAAGLVVGVAYPYRAHPALAAMRTFLRNNRLGQPLQVTVVAGQHFPTYRPAYRDTYYRQRSSGGGAIQDALTHLINAVEWLVGPTTSVVADAACLKLDGVEVEDTAHVLARHADILTSYSLNQHQPANELTITVVCERGQARFESHRARWSWLGEVDGAWQEEIFQLDRDTLFRQQAEAFLSSI